jgi:hypothetical protein
MLPEIRQEDMQSYMNRYAWIESQIDTLKKTLMQLRQNRRPTPVMSRTFLLACAIANMGAIQLNRPLATHNFQAGEKTLIAAKSVTDMVASIDIRVVTCMYPIISVCVCLTDDTDLHSSLLPSLFGQHHASYWRPNWRI